jgi:exosortase
MNSSSNLALDRRHALFAGLVAIAFAVCHQAWGTVLRLALSSDQYSHILLVVPVSVTLVYLERRKIFSVVSFSKPAGTVLAVLLAGFLGTAAYWRPPTANDFVSVSMLFCVLWWIAAFVFCYGARAFQVDSFPLLFLILMIPMPDGPFQRTVTFLQNGSTDASALIFRAAHVPFTRHGTVLVLPKISIEVARECSSIRSSLILFISSFVLAHLFLKRWWQKVLLVLLAIPLSVAKNGLRIFTLSMLGMYVNPGFLTGRLHHHGGIVFFAVGFAILLGVIWLLHKLEPRGANPQLPD